MAGPYRHGCQAAPPYYSPALAADAHRRVLRSKCLTADRFRTPGRNATVSMSLTEKIRDRRDDGITNPEAASTHASRAVLYDQYVTSGAAGPDDGSMRRYLKKMIRDHLPSDRSVRIFDFGCGAGELLRCCREAGYRTLRGIDVSAQQVARAQAKGLEAIVSQGDAVAFLEATAPESFDVVFAFDILEHLSKPEVLRFFSAAARALGKSGSVIVHVPNGDSPFFGAVRYADFTHEQAFTAGSLRQIASSSGFSSVRCYEHRPVAYGLKSTIRALLWPLSRGLLAAMTAVETGILDRKAVFSRNLLAIIERS
jgi:2-polyprenyl-3-methyl-5-hydroxy-6-metoxy-1,4-benzoquinol methylase